MRKALIIGVMLGWAVGVEARCVVQVKDAEVDNGEVVGMRVRLVQQTKATDHAVFSTSYDATHAELVGFRNVPGWKCSMRGRGGPGVALVATTAFGADIKECLRDAGFLTVTGHSIGVASLEGD